MRPIRRRPRAIGDLLSSSRARVERGGSLALVVAFACSTGLACSDGAEMLSQVDAGADAMMDPKADGGSSSDLGPPLDGGSTDRSPGADSGQQDSDTLPEARLELQVLDMPPEGAEVRVRQNGATLLSARRSGSFSVAVTPEVRVDVVASSVRCGSDVWPVETSLDEVVLEPGDTGRVVVRYRPLIPVDGLLSRFPLDDGRVVDTAGEVSEARVLGATAVPDRAGRPDLALGFDGIDDRVELGDVLNHLVAPASFSLWVRVPMPAPRAEPFFFLDDPAESPGTYSGFWLQTSANGTALEASYGSGGVAGPSSRRSATLSEPVNLTRWVHVGIRYESAGDITMFVNGTMADAPMSGSAPELVRTPNVARLGFSRTGAPRYLGGELDELRIYERSLLDCELFALSRDLGS